MDDLKKKTLKGLLYLGVGKGAGRFISFASTLILARLLNPQDYGLMALVMVVVGFFQFFNEIGLGSALRQRTEITPEQLDGSFTLSLLISVTLFSLVYAASPWIAAYYEHPELLSVLRLVALSFIIGAGSTVSDALLARAMLFKHVASVEFVTILVQSALTLILAWLDYGVWALAWGFVAGQALRASLIVFLARWRPRKLGEMRAASELMRFGLSVTYSRLTWFVYSNGQTAIIGKTLNAQAVGVYAMAESLANLLTGQITSMVISVASPLFAKLQHDMKRLNNVLLRMTKGIALINFPIVIGMACTATELVPVVLGPQWMEAILPLQVLCILSLLKAVDPLLTQALISTGQVGITARYTSLCAITIPSSVYLGSVIGGLNGVAIGIAVAYPLSATYLLWSVRRYLKLSLLAYLQAVRLPLEASAWMASWILGIAWMLRVTGFQHDVLLLATKVMVGAIAYSSYLIYLRCDGLQDAHEVLCELGVPESKLRRWPFTKLKIRHTP